MNKNDFREEILWQFVIDDIKLNEFERLIYDSNQLFEEFLGSELYLKLISASFKNDEETKLIKDVIVKFLTINFPRKCNCLQMGRLNYSRIIGSEKKINTMKKLIQRDEPFWWINLYECLECHQGWLTATDQEEADVYFKKLDKLEFQNIINNNTWPAIFNDYKGLIELRSNAKAIDF